MLKSLTLKLVAPNQEPRDYMVKLMNDTRGLVPDCIPT